MCANHCNDKYKEQKIGKLQEILASLTGTPNDQIKEIKDIHVWLEKLSETSDTNDTSTLVVRKKSKEKTNGSMKALYLSGSSEFSTRARSPSQRTKETPLKPNAKFESWQPKHTQDYTTKASLRIALETPLSKKELKPAFIYMLHVDQSGHLKVGYSKDTEKRRKSWNAQCGYDHQFHKPSHNDVRAEVPHAKRVETLMHTELKECRKIVECAGCEKTHREWFEIPEHHVMAVFQKWKRWIETLPYEKRKDGRWMLRDPESGVHDDVCIPVSLDMSDGCFETSPAPMTSCPSAKEASAHSPEHKTVSRSKKDTARAKTSSPRLRARLEGKGRE
jgi:hypothetical protein